MRLECSGWPWAAQTHGALPSATARHSARALVHAWRGRKGREGARERERERENKSWNPPCQSLKNSLETLATETALTRPKSVQVSSLTLRRRAGFPRAGGLPELLESGVSLTGILLRPIASLRISLLRSLQGKFQGCPLDVQFRP